MAPSADRHGDPAGRHTEHNVRAISTEQLGDDVCRPEGGVPGERELVVGSEDADRGVDVVVRVQGTQEGRLREVELAGDGLHLVRRQRGAVLEDRQGVAGERVVAHGEDVDETVGQVHPASLPRGSAVRVVRVNVTSASATPAEPAGHLILVRHGETEWSRSGQHTGLTDVALTAEGEAAAKRAGTLLAGRTFARVLSSPLLRARRTAELAGLASPEIDARLVEWDYGGYEGLTTAQIREQLRYRWTVFDHGVVPGDTPGETVESVAARAAAVLADVRGDLEQGDVALVGHGHCLRILATVFLRQEVRMGAQLLLDAGSVSVLEYEREQPAIRTWNQSASR
jgi:probable phosphoglycerate mutase